MNLLIPVLKRIKFNSHKKNNTTNNGKTHTNHNYCIDIYMYIYIQINTHTLDKTLKRDFCQKSKKKKK